LDNITLALDMVAKAKIKTNFLKATHLVDHDLKMILGMIWAIILDYAIKGISVEDLSAKEGLLLWCRKKTAGYRDIDPPGIQNFTRDWRNGLAFCALIHRHRPDLLSYNNLDKNNAEQNLELAFSVAEKELGIPRLLEVTDVTTERPDERSIMTYVSEYFHRFASQTVRETAAKRAAKFIQFQREIAQRQFDYENNAKVFIAWAKEISSQFRSASFGTSLDDAQAVIANLKDFVLNVKPHKNAEKLDLESDFAEIQTQLKVNNRPAYMVPGDASPDAVDGAWSDLSSQEQAYAKKAREHRFKFIKKIESKIPEEKLQEFNDSFKHFDKDNDNALDKNEFRAALQAMSIPFKNEEGFNKVFSETSEGGTKINMTQYIRFLTDIYEDRDTADSIRGAFKAMADEGSAITEAQLNTPPLTEQDVSYLSSTMPRDTSGRAFDYNKFIDQAFLGK